jgi:phage shock protein B
MGVGSAMNSVFIVAIVFGGLVLALAIVGSAILIGIRMVKGGFSRKGQAYQADETKMIQQLYQGLSRMEERVDALETILLDREREGKTG